MKVFSFATTRPSAAAPKITRTGVLFTIRFARPDNVATFEPVFLTRALVDRREATPFLCFALMHWHDSHDRANAAAA